MSGVTKPLKKVHDKVRSLDPVRAIVGKKNYDKLDVYGNYLDESVATQDAAKSEKQTAARLEAELRKRQTIERGQSADEENRRIKGMLVGGRYGTRGYRGSPLFRARPSNTAGVALRTSSSVGGASPASAAQAAGGARGGMSRGGFRVSHQ